ncbi:MAG: hypothetical protein CMJ83_12875 [Planctomycetes bacterium]|nr:hypothetical protein [Planctomycetota bacterium]
MGTEPLLPPGATGPGRIGSFDGANGRALRYRTVDAAGEEPRHYLLYCHGIESHGTWFLPAAERLAEHGCTTFLVDRRGSGLNRGEEPGHARSADILLEDVARFRDHVGDPLMWLVGLSWGGKLAIAAAMARPSSIRGLVLVTPGLKALVDLTPGQKLKFLASLPVGGRARLQVPIRPEMFTETPRFLDFIRQDPWRLKLATAKFFSVSLKLDRQVADGIDSLEKPVLLFLAGGERIIDNDGVTRLLQRLPGGCLQIHMYDDATHSIQFDQVERMVDDTMAFLDGSTAP